MNAEVELSARSVCLNSHLDIFSRFLSLVQFPYCESSSAFTASPCVFHFLFFGPDDLQQTDPTRPAHEMKKLNKSWKAFDVLKRGKRNPAAGFLFWFYCVFAGVGETERKHFKARWKQMKNALAETSPVKF